MLDRAQERFDIAVRAARPLWRGGCWLRLGLLGGMWLVVLTTVTSPAQIGRAALQLTVGSAAVALAFAHTSADALDRLDRVPGTGWLVGHMSTTSGRATVDAPGLFEGLGLLLGIWLFVGPLPLTEMPASARVLGTVLAIAYVWDAVLQAVIDPGWYAPDPPSRGMRVFRWFIPPILGGLTLFVLWPFNGTAAELPPAVRLLLVVSPLLYYPAWFAFAALLDAGVDGAAAAVVRDRQETAGNLHSLVKNPVRMLCGSIADPDVGREEIERQGRTALMSIEEFRRDLLSGGSADRAAQTFGELWHDTLGLLNVPDRHRCGLAAGSATVVLSPADYQLARVVLPDLVTNALRAGARRVEAACRLTTTGDTDRVEIGVRDDGPGFAPDALAAPTTSLTVLGARLRRLDGDVRHHRSDGRTEVVARWGRQGDAIRWHRVTQEAVS